MCGGIRGSSSSIDTSQVWWLCEWNVRWVKCYLCWFDGFPVAAYRTTSISKWGMWVKGYMGYVSMIRLLPIMSTNYVSHYYPDDLLTGKSMHWCCNLQQRKIAQGGQHGGSTNVTLLSRTRRKHSWNEFGAKLHQRKQFPLGRRICGFEDVAFYEGHIFRHSRHARALCTILHNEVRIPWNPYSLWNLCRIHLRGMSFSLHHLHELANLCQWCDGHHASKQWRLWPW